jgi:hypothetical protein
LQAAQTACQPLYPNNGSLQQQTQQCVSTGNCPQTLLQQLMTVERSYARCMRSHGVPTWPDPTVGAKGRPVFDLSSAGIDPQSTDSSQFQSKEAACRSLVGSVPNLPRHIRSLHERHSHTSPAQTRTAPGRDHRHGRAGHGGLQQQRQQPVIGCRRIDGFPVGGRLLGLHAFARSVELPRPR